MTASHGRTKRIIFLFLVLLFAISCNGDEEPPVSEETAVARQTDFDYLVTTDDAPAVEVSGSEFEITTNNCGSRTSALESFSRSREFVVALDAEISQSIRGQLGGDILVAGAELETAVGASLGVSVGSTETVRTERQIETPPDSISVVTLRWEEIWQNGRVSIFRNDGTSIGDVPFRVLTTMRLSQIGIQDMPCGTLTVTSTSESEPSATNTPAGSEDAPVSTTAPPAPTNTQAPPPTPQPSATPRATNPPPPLVNEVHTIDAYRTALGSSYNTEIYVQAGDNVSISYLNGQWWIGQGSSCNGFGDSQTPTDAGGYTGRDGERVEALIGCSNPNICRPLISAPWGSLLGMIGDNGALFNVGRQADFVAQDSGILYLRINYYNHNAVTGCPYGDGGEISARVIVTEP